MTLHLLRSFDRICIINLAERTDRRRAVIRELQRQGVAVDGDRVRFVAGTRPDGPGAFPSTGARGCFLSHLSVLRQARADGVKRLLVLEDDVMFTGALANAGPLGVALALDDWHLAYPGHAQPPSAGPLRWQRTDAPLVCAHCYAVRGDALPWLIEHLEACLLRPSGHPLGSPMHYDGALTVLRAARPDLITLLASQSVAGQRSSRSDIIGPSWLDRWPWAALASGLRAAKNQWRRLAGAI
jgi:glycosyl transferase family 25